MAAMQCKVTLLLWSYAGYPTRSCANKDIFLSLRTQWCYTTVGTTISLALTACPTPYPPHLFRPKVLTACHRHHVLSGGMIPLYLVVNSLGMMDTIWAVVLPVSINTYNMIIIRTTFSAVPEAMIESAQLDGANDFVILFRFIIPVSKAVLATMLLFYAVSYWNSFFNEMLYLNSKSKYPMQIILRNILISGLFLGGGIVHRGSSASPCRIHHALGRHYHHHPAISDRVPVFAEAFCQGRDDRP
jgi:ABC-type glycerol-3-phosphate transport system permease component